MFYFLQSQNAFTVNVILFPESMCLMLFFSDLSWTDSPASILPTIDQLISSGISIWIYRYDINFINCSVTSMTLSMLYV